uniref:Homing endonuclease n=1 Tax=Siphoviridae sp. ctVif31 TaxID=2825532 RepID=A0A8S5Q2E3_9CAUD|nr:MAG TPA: homing endonuclease [Siphoviridae sp. ctVif31]
MNKVIWKPTYAYGEQYEISNTGIVRNKFTKKELSLQKDNKGYLRARLSLHDKKITVKVHRLVAQAFIPNTEMKPQVNHIDGNKENNCTENLEWVTNSENQLHAYKNNLNYVTGKAGREKIPIIQIDINGKIIERFDSIGEASRKIGIQRQNIEKVIRGERLRAGGFFWKKESEVVPNAETVNY